MSRLNVYLSSAEKNAVRGFTEWRTEAKKYCATYMDIRLCDPMIYFNYNTNVPVSEKQCINHFMWLIDKCEVILVNLDYSNVSIGTGMEIQHAYDTKKPIIGFGNKNLNHTWYPWIAERCEVIFDTMEEALSYIDAYYAIY